MTPTTNLKGTGTTVTGLLTLVLGILGALGQILGAVQGKSVDPTAGLGAGSAIVSGVGLIKAADSRQ